MKNPLLALMLVLAIPFGFGFAGIWVSPYLETYSKFLTTGGLLFVYLVLCGSFLVEK